MDYYDGLALARARDNIGAARIAMAIEALDAGSVEAWREAGGERLTRARAQILDMVEGGALSVSRVTVAANLLADAAPGRGALAA